MLEGRISATHCRDVRAEEELRVSDDSQSAYTGDRHSKEKSVLQWKVGLDPFPSRWKASKPPGVLQGSFLKAVGKGPDLDGPDLPDFIRSWLLSRVSSG